MICGKCRNKIENGLESCPICGARFKKVVEENTQAQQSPQTPKDLDNAVESEIITNTVKEKKDDSKAIKTPKKAKLQKTKNGDGFIKVIAPYIKAVTKVSCVLAVTLLLISIVLAEIILVKDGVGVIKGFIKPNMLASILGLIFGLVAAASAALCTISALRAEKDSKQKAIIKASVLVTCAIAVLVLSIVSIILAA